MENKDDCDKRNDKLKVAVIGPDDATKRSVVSTLASVGISLVDMDEGLGLTHTEDILSDQKLIDAFTEVKWSHLTKKQKALNIEHIRNSKENPKINRNQPCPCGSGKKWKKCCSK